MERTISGMMGNGAINHNTRAFNAKNVDPERSIYNVQFCNTSIKKVYHELFDEALERYNAKQKRSNRRLIIIMKKSDRVSRRSCSMRLFCKLAIKTI